MQVAIINNHPTMSSRDIAELVESRHADVCRTIERLVEKGVIGGCAPSAYTHEQNGQQYNEYHLDKRSSLIVVAQLSPEFTARIVDRWQELEAQQSLSIPNFADPAAAAIAWAEQYRARQIAEQTKALIGAKREATAMNTASQAVKRANKLEIQLDKAKQYASVKRMEMLYHGQQFNWRLLKSTSAEMGIPSIDIFDANYGTVKAYHADVWAEAYAVEIIVTEAA